MKLTRTRSRQVFSCLLVAVAILVVGCFKQRANKVQIGMTNQQVVSVLGDPAYVKQRGDLTAFASDPKYAGVQTIFIYDETGDSQSFFVCFDAKGTVVLTEWAIYMQTS